jgi:hypothetical protein
MPGLDETQESPPAGRFGPIAWSDRSFRNSLNSREKRARRQKERFIEEPGKYHVLPAECGWARLRSSHRPLIARYALSGASGSSGFVLESTAGSDV